MDYVKFKKCSKGNKSIIMVENDIEYEQYCMEITGEDFKDIEDYIPYTNIYGDTYLLIGIDEFKEMDGGTICWILNTL